MLPCTAGPSAGTNFRLRPRQKKFIRDVYRTDKAGRRLVLDGGSLGRTGLSKRKSTGRIDPLIGLTMALGVASRHEAQTGLDAASRGGLKNRPATETTNARNAITSAKFARLAACAVSLATCNL